MTRPSHPLITLARDFLGCLIIVGAIVAALVVL